MDLHDRWHGTWGAVRRPAPDGSVDELIQRYGEPQRAYHTAEHLAECFAHLDACPVEPEDRGALELALWYHDAVYDPRAKDSEARSAALARERLGSLNSARLDRIEALILATAQHVASTDRHAQLLVDIDLAILGAHPARFAAYEAEIRHEYDWVPKRLYNRERRRVLRSFSDRERIYVTDWFHERFEERARTNLP